VGENGVQYLLPRSRARYDPDPASRLAYLRKPSASDERVDNHRSSAHSCVFPVQRSSVALGLSSAQRRIGRLLEGLMSADTALAAEPPMRGRGESVTYDAFLSYSRRM
jgi:hypothetical protein